MTPLVWTTPWALAGLAAVPVLVAIYWLRFRYRPRPVSTLLFWRDIPELRDAGVRWQKLHLPWLFFLELLALVTIVGAALGVHLLMPQSVRPLVVILDDSLSMQAGQPSARAEAERQLRELLRHRRFASVRLLLAGTTPQWLGPAVTELHALDPMLEQWQCWQPMASLERALATAREWGGTETLVLVLTDTPPAVPVEAGWLQWWACGSPKQNVAIIHAVRTVGKDRDRLVLELANYSAEPTSTVLQLRSGQTLLQETPITLQPGETQTLHFTVPAQLELVEAVLPADDLEADNHVWLVRAPIPPIQVRLEVSHAALRSALEKALLATGPVVFDSTTPQVWITDSPTARPAGTTWLVQLIVEKDGEAFTGPFILDRQHPLCEGLTLQGAIWGARREAIEGTPIVSVGDVPLLTETLRGLNRRHFRLRLIPELSNLHRVPDWPILWTNLMDWRRRELPGPETVSARIGEVLRVRCDASAKFAGSADKAPVIVCRLPDGNETEYPVRQGVAFVPLQRLGVYEITDGSRHWKIGANMLQPGESDLRRCARGQWGQWLDEEILRRHYRDTSWAFLLVALGLLIAHSWLVWRWESQR
jgi:hypothetical protein